MNIMGIQPLQALNTKDEIIYVLLQVRCDF